MVKSTKPRRSIAPQSAAAPLVENCGSVGSAAKPITIPEIQRLVLAIVPAQANTPDKWKISKLRTLSAEPVYNLAQDCMNFGRFQQDGLSALPNYFNKHGQTFGEFYKCIMCCYKNRRAKP